jgi:hypothetical protein
MKGEPNPWQSCPVAAGLSQLVNALEEDAFQALYGPWDPLEPTAVAALLAEADVRWYIAGGRAARVGACPRSHDDTDLVIRAGDLEELRSVLSGWHLWEAHDGALRPLLPGLRLSQACEQLWVRRSASHPWQLDVLLDVRSTDAEWIFKRDASVRLPRSRALHTVDGVQYLRPELALLHKARLDRPKDRADLAAAVLEPEARAWLADTLDRLGNSDWVRLVRQGGGDLGEPSAP